MRNKTKLKIGKASTLACVWFLYFMLFFWLFFFTFYVHESGHIIFGFADGALKGRITSFSIGNWEEMPLTPLILLPQQTRIVNGHGSLNFALGGPIFTMIVFLGISLFGYRLSRNIKWFLPFLAIVLFEVSGNIICGTDNFTGNPLAFCNRRIDLAIQYFSIIFFSGVLTWFTTRKLKDRFL